MWREQDLHISRKLENTFLGGKGPGNVEKTFVFLVFSALLALTMLIPAVTVSRKKLFVLKIIRFDLFLALK